VRVAAPHADRRAAPTPTTRAPPWRTVVEQSLNLAVDLGQNEFRNPRGGFVYQERTPHSSRAWLQVGLPRWFGRQVPAIEQLAPFWSPGTLRTFGTGTATILPSLLKTVPLRGLSNARQQGHARIEQATMQCRKELRQCKLDRVTQI